MGFRKIMVFRISVEAFGVGDRHRSRRRLRVGVNRGADFVKYLALPRIKGSSLLLALITESMYCVILPVTFSFSIEYS